MTDDDREDAELEYADALKDYTTSDKVRMTLFQMLARNQLSQADVITLAVLGASGAKAFWGTDAYNDDSVNARADTLASLLSATIRKEFDDSRPEVKAMVKNDPRMV